MPVPYDPSDENSILEYGKRLIGKTIRDLKEEGLDFSAPRGKTGIGDIIEAYFGLRKNSDEEPDFKKCGLELKTAPLNATGEPRYPLSLSMINFEKLKSEIWRDASFKRKVSNLLLVYYDEAEDHFDCRVRYVFIWKPRPEDWLLLEADWKTIRKILVREGPEGLSERRTNVLAARVKAQKGGKGRCFALKRQFMGIILAAHTARKRIRDADLSSEVDLKEPDDLVDEVIRRARPFLGMTVGEIHESIEPDVHYHRLFKSYAAYILNMALGVGQDKALGSGLGKAGLRLKTVRCNPGHRPIYAMSLRGFDYVRVGKVEWQDSKCYEDVSRMLIAVLTLPHKDASQEEAVLEKVFFHKPSPGDLKTMRQDWEMLSGMVRDGRAHEITGHLGRIIQARPKGINAKDTKRAPGGHELVKKAFFLRTDYLRRVLQRELDG